MLSQKKLSHSLLKCDILIYVTTEEDDITELKFSLEAIISHLGNVEK